MSQGRRISRGTWKQRAIFAAAVAFYLAGYPAVRTEQLLVHTKTYVTSAGDPVVADHGIAPGDFGTPTLALGTTFATLLASVIYWPITLVEVVYWDMVEPPGSPYDGPTGPAPTFDEVPAAAPGGLPPGATPP